MKKYFLALFHDKFVGMDSDVIPFSGFIE